MRGYWKLWKSFPEWKRCCWLGMVGSVLIALEATYLFLSMEIGGPKDHGDVIIIYTGLLGSLWTFFVSYDTFLTNERAARLKNKKEE
ncbi:MAG: hypothetical protein AAB463_01385 [Patescibacteria group bacterium]